MTDEMDKTQSRRRVLKTAALGAAALAGAGLARRGRAQDAEPVDPGSPIAQALHYVKDASMAPADLRTNMDAFCHNCQFYMSDQQTGSAPCTIFMGMLVPAEAWCSSWVMKGAGAGASQ